MRSKLFVPGSRPELFAKAFSSEADAVTIDLEDAVTEDQKQYAREQVTSFLEASGNGDDALTIVRINDQRTHHYLCDLMAVIRPNLDWVNVPKIESAEDVRSVCDLVAAIERRQNIEHEIGILANIETPAGLRNAAEIAKASSRLRGLQIGFGDLFTPLGVKPTPEAKAQVRYQVRLAAGEADLPCYDSAFVNIADQDGFEADAMDARHLGFEGKSCIHPSQITQVNRIFTPTDAEIEQASRIVSASRQAEKDKRGAFVLDGVMVDLPFIRSAERTIDTAQRLGFVAPTT